MKKRRILFSISVGMLVFAILFVIRALGNPQESLPLSLPLTYTIYGVYMVTMIGVFVASRVIKKKS